MFNRNRSCLLISAGHPTLPLSFGEITGEERISYFGEMCQNLTMFMQVSHMCELHHVFMGKNKLMKVLVNVFILDKFTMSILYARSCTGTEDPVLEQNKTQVWP